jgi:hypothetical protein
MVKRAGPRASPFLFLSPKAFSTRYPAAAFAAVSYQPLAISFEKKTNPKYPAAALAAVGCRLLNGK